MKKQIIAIASFLLTLTPLAANAQYDSPHKWTDSFGKTRIYIPGVADGVVDVLTESSKEYTFTSDFCGWIRIRQSDTRKIKRFSTPTNSLNVDFSNISYDSIGGSNPTPICNYNGTDWVMWDGPPYYNSNRPLGSLWRVNSGNQFYIKVLTPTFSAAFVSTIQGTVIYENTIKNKINSCGFGTITVSPTRPMNTFKIAGTNYSLDTLPSVAKPQLCRIQNGAKVRYLPLN